MRNGIVASYVAVATIFIGSARAAMGMQPAGSYELVAVEQTVSSGTPSSGPTTIYLNRLGGTYTPGRNDSTQNTTSLVDDPVVMPAFSGTDQAWTALVECVASQFSGFDVDVTATDPGDVAHYEAVIGGEPADLNRPDHIGGISPFRLDCGVIDNSIVFIFSDLYTGDTTRLCEVVAQEVAHSFGLDHQMSCNDPMSYIGGCGEKRFQNIDAACGEYEERECACGQPSQNSKKLLARHLGDVVPPELDILAPTGVVPSSFCAVASAVDDVGVDKVELRLDGKEVASRGTAPFAFELEDLSPGAHSLELRAHDSANVTTRTVDVLVDPALAPTSCSEVQLLGQTLEAVSDVRAGCQSAPSRSPALPAMAPLIAMLCLGWHRRRARRS